MPCSRCPTGSRPLPALRRALSTALSLALTPLAAGAATIAVTSPDDSDTAATDTCTLRQAIMSIDVGGLIAACHKTGTFGIDDTITFAASAVSGALTPGTVTLADSADPNGGLGGTLVVTAARLTIDGSDWRGNGEGHYSDGVTIARPTGASNKFGVLRGTASAGGELVLKGIAIRNGYALAGDGGGISMMAANLKMIDSRVSGNRANVGGGVSSQSGDILLTHCTIDGNIGYLGGGVHSASGTVTLTASTISGNGEWGSSAGGGIRADGTLLVIGSTINGNSGMHGAGIETGGELTLIDSTVASNEAYSYGGGLHVRAGASATVTGSTINGNSARYNGGGAYSQGSLSIVNSTIAGNTVFRDGGGIALYGGGTLHLDHATLARNHAGAAGGGVGYTEWTGVPWTGNATIAHSIVSDNEQANGTDVNLRDAWSGTGNLLSSPIANLGALQDNGGPTPTMLPGAGSAAIDAIALQDCTQASDQRGVSRPQATGCDIGAVEVVRDIIFADDFDGGSTAQASPDG